MDEFAVTKEHVGGLAPLHWWKDFWLFQPTIFRALKRCPFVVAYVLISAAISSVTDSFDKVLRIPDGIALLSMTLTIIFEVWAQLRHQPRQEHKLDYKHIVSAWGNSICFGLAIVFGGLLFLLPGIYFLFGASLGIVFVCLEEKRAGAAFDASCKLVKGKFGRTMSYLCGAPLLMGLAVTVAVVVPVMFANDVFDQTPAYKVLMFACSLATEWIVLSIVPLQVRLYAYLKQSKSADQLLTNNAQILATPNDGTEPG
jgi:hypothetical protein